MAVSTGSERVGLAVWIIDRALGREAEIDEETAARTAIAELIERRLIGLTATRRLEATGEGIQLWQPIKPT